MRFFLFLYKTAFRLIDLFVSQILNLLTPDVLCEMRGKKNPHLQPHRRLYGEGAHKHTHSVHTSTWSSHFLRKLQSQLNLADGPWKHAHVWVAACTPQCSCVQYVPVKAVVNHWSWCLLWKCWLKSHSCIGKVLLAIWSLIYEAHSPSSFDFSQALTNQKCLWINHL